MALRPLKLIFILSTHLCVLALSSEEIPPLGAENNCKSLISINERLTNGAAVSSWIKKNFEEQNFTYEKLTFELSKNGYTVAVNKIYRSINQPPKKVDSKLIFALEKVFGNPFTDYSVLDESKLTKYTIRENLDFFLAKGMTYEDISYYLRHSLGFRAPSNLIWRHRNLPPDRKSYSLEINLNTLRELKYPEEF